MTLSRIAAIAVAGALTAGPAPAAAAPACTTPTGYAAGAGAEAMALNALDLRPLGVPVGPVADLRVGSSRSAFDPEAGPVKAAAAARYLDVKLTGIDLPSGPLSRTAYQQAPPRNAKPVAVHANRQRLGVASAGAADLSAYATWHDGLACGTKPAEGTRTEAAIAGADVLAGPGGIALVRIPAALRTRTATGLHTAGSPVATAWAGVTEARILAGTPAEVSVRVVQPATLTVGRDVAYEAPTVEISSPRLGVRRVHKAGEVVDVPLGRLGGTVGALKLDRLEGVTGRAGEGPLQLPGLPAVPGLPLAGGLPGIEAGGSVLRVTTGALEKEVTGEWARAEATSVRIQVVTRPADDDAAAIVDLSLGRLDAIVLAPRQAATPTPPAGAAGGLPVTGANVTWVAIFGALLLMAGSVTLLASRRRPATDRPNRGRTYG